MKSRMLSTFWKGLLALLPLYVTIYFMIWLLRSIESTFGQPIKLALGSYYLPGMGIITAVFIIMP